MYISNAMDGDKDHTIFGDDEELDTVAIHTTVYQCCMNV